MASEGKKGSQMDFLAKKNLKSDLHVWGKNTFETRTDKEYLLLNWSKKINKSITKEL